MSSLLTQLSDPYERQARITPGLLVILPIVVPLVCVYGAQHPALTSVVALLFGCGAVYALASIARGRGKALEERLTSRWGGLPTTIALRHRDRFFDAVTKSRYHNAIRSALNINVPSPDAELADPAQADDAYIAATRRLRELTRNDKSLLLKENVAYGFHRNTLAMKPIGITTTILGLLYGLALADVLRFTSPYIHPTGLFSPGLPATLTLLVSLAMLAAWLFYFNERAVRRVGFAYAERLFEHGLGLESGKAASGRRRGA